jgi:hypothetical protein
MNWIVVICVAAIILVSLEILVRQTFSLGRFFADRLKTFSARATVAFLSAFALLFPLASIGAGPWQKLILLVMVVVLIVANFIHPETKPS